jgi:hypothetical protein
VTDTGRVYLAPRYVKPGTPLKEIWNRDPVEALIHDNDDKTWYAFTKTHYFEIAEAVKPIQHAITVKRSWTADKALETAVACARVIRQRQAPSITDRTWEQLASHDARIAHAATRALVNDPSRALTLLADRLKPIQMPSENDLTALVEDLGAETFAVRDAAEKQLRDYGLTIEPAVREALAKSKNAEQRNRLTRLVSDWPSPGSRTANEIRAARAVEVLERINTADSRRVLQSWATGAEAAVLTREARRALRAVETIKGKP